MDRAIEWHHPHIVGVMKVPLAASCRHPHSRLSCPSVVQAWEESNHTSFWTSYQHTEWPDHFKWRVQACVLALLHPGNSRELCDCIALVVVDYYSEFHVIIVLLH